MKLCYTECFRTGTLYSFLGLLLQSKIQKISTVATERNFRIKKKIKIESKLPYKIRRMVSFLRGIHSLKAVSHSPIYVIPISCSVRILTQIQYIETLSDN